MVRQLIRLLLRVLSLSVVAMFGCEDRPLPKKELPPPFLVIQDPTKQSLAQSDMIARAYASSKVAYTPNEIALASEIAQIHASSKLAPAPNMQPEVTAPNWTTNSRSTRMPIKFVDGAYCPRTRDEKYTVRITWRNDGNRPVRTVYATIRVFDRAGELTSFGAVDYPIYSVPDTHPGVAPGETHSHKNGEGYVVPIRIGGSEDSLGSATAEMMGGTEAGIQ